MSVLKLKPAYLVLGAAALGAAWLLMPSFRSRLINRLSEFIPGVEGFSATPYWDVSRYSWGYGTKAPGATGTITRAEAFGEMLSYLLSDYNTLRPYITRDLTVAQWAAYLSFSYNLGTDDAIDIAPYINANNDSALHDQWMRYVHAGGKVNSTLVSRRNKEWLLWNA